MFSLEGMKYLTDEVNSVHPLMDSVLLAMCNGHFLDSLMYFSIISLRPVTSCGRGDCTWPWCQVYGRWGLAQVWPETLTFLFCMLVTMCRVGVGGMPADTEKEEVCLVDTGGFLIF